MVNPPSALLLLAPWPGRPRHRLGDSLLLYYYGLLNMTCDCMKRKLLDYIIA